DGINKLFNPIIHTKQLDNEDIASIFVSKLQAITNNIYKDYYKKPKPLKLTKQEQEEFDKAEFCHICKKELYDDDSTGKMLKDQKYGNKAELLFTDTDSLMFQIETDDFYKYIKRYWKKI
ncbi:unnamed protein product, partial [Porites evermanni]